MQERRRLLVWWLTGSATLLVILIAFAGYFVIATAGSFIHPTWGCLPGDFPRYTHAVIQEIDQTFDTLPLGATQECRMRIATADSYNEVYDFYYKQFSAGDWTWSFIGGSEQTGGAIMSFNRKSRPQTHGSMTIHAQRGGTPFEVQLIT